MWFDYNLIKYKFGRKQPWVERNEQEILPEGWNSICVFELQRVFEITVGEIIVKPPINP